MDVLLRLLLLLFSFAWATLVVVAEKDSNYYPPGYSNPNVNKKMYWKEGTNVLEDLDQFDKLYVQFHNCAWSPFRQGEEDWMCGYRGDADADEWDGSPYWYLGVTQCFRANVGYSLYGILKGEEDVGCEQSTFINSFLTTRGAATFVQALQYQGHVEKNGDVDYSDFNAHCYLEGENEYYDEYEEQGEEGWNIYDPADFVSYGLGCSGGNFVIQNFQGKYCSGRDVIQTVDKLKDINKEIQQSASCAVIYERSAHNENEEEEENGYNYEEQDDEEDGYEDYFQIGSALGILRYSHSCSTKLYPRECPDPYGLVSQYEHNLHGKTQGSGDYRLISALRKAGGTIMLVAGLIMFGYAFCVCKDIGKEIKKPQIEPDPEEQESVPLIKKISSRVISNISQASKSVKSAIQSYAEEELTDGEEESQEGEEVQYMPTYTGSDSSSNTSVRGSTQTGSVHGSSVQGSVARLPSVQGSVARLPSVQGSIQGSVRSMAQTSTSVHGSIQTSSSSNVGSGPASSVTGAKSIEQVASGNLAVEIELGSATAGSVRSLAPSGASVQSSSLPSFGSLASLRSGSACSVTGSKKIEQVASGVLEVEIELEPSGKVPPPANASVNEEETNNEEVANAMLEEKNLKTTTTTPADKKKYKRPLLARLSKRLFRGKKSQKKAPF